MKVLGKDLGLKFCHALGLNPDRVRELELHLAVGEVAHVVVHQMVESDEGDKLVELVKTYTLHDDEGEKVK